ncbi:sortase [Candidatus Dojkabacteria bacterium]|nr:sortase [Candidatus Dojkabacteria bacterium]
MLYSKNKKEHSIRTLLLVLCSLALTIPLPIYLFVTNTQRTSKLQTEVNASDITADAVTAENVDYVYDEDQNLPETQEQTSKSTIEIKEFSIEIPKIELEHDIKENVNPAQSEIYMPILDQYIAHGLGTALPDEYNGNTYLFAHSKNSYGWTTPDGGWFTRLDELVLGDTIYIRYNGTLYKYVVEDILIVTPEETYVYRANSWFDDTSSLTLQTCYPRGTTDKRLIIIAKQS